MADIKRLVDNIRKAIYGEEVQESFAAALEAINDDNNKYQDIKDIVVKAGQKVDAAQTEMAELVGATEQATAERKTLEKKITDAVTVGTAINNAVTAASTAAGEANTAADAANTAAASVYTDKNFLLLLNEDMSVTLTYSEETETGE